jgi:hypothetical protein
MLLAIDDLKPVYVFGVGTRRGRKVVWWLCELGKYKMDGLMVRFTCLLKWHPADIESLSWWCDTSLTTLTVSGQTWWVFWYPLIWIFQEIWCRFSDSIYFIRGHSLTKSPNDTPIARSSILTTRESSRSHSPVLFETIWAFRPEVRPLRYCRYPMQVPNPRATSERWEAPAQAPSKPSER